MTMTGKQAVQLAAEYIGCDATKFRVKYKAMTGQSTSGNWCCVFASAIVCGWAGAKLEGLPSTWCPDARKAATNAGREVSVEQARPGDVVYFEWSGNENADHVGIFESYSNGVLTTVDGNVSNRVGRRSRVKGRDYRKVWVVRPEYAAEAKQVAAKLLVDGVFGKVTVKRLQKALRDKGYYDGVIDGVFGPMTAKALQRYLAKLGYYTMAIDGSFGHFSTIALQNWLRNLGYYTTAYIIDGVWGKVTTKCLQQALNAGKF